ncbi:hypothetical protein ABGB12_14055 [Actinocorallia sp. B10E7]|uniref:hypothetical protein n=1 Tax=Actinocorallia sp. B10E7 TaxID=3153558 RepID=UPI00325E3816
MRFTARALGALAAAGILVITHPGAAFASDGYLRIGKRIYGEPNNGDCHGYNRNLIKNATDGYVAIYSGYGCKRKIKAVLTPYSYAIGISGKSVCFFQGMPENRNEKCE